jgi:two-component system phosphate regulon sensor histidine kinase PhoR
MNGTGQGSPLLPLRLRTALAGGRASGGSTYRTRRPSRPCLLLSLAIILSGAVITTLVHSVDRKNAEREPVTHPPAPRAETSALLWWGAAIALASGAALLLLRLRTRQIRITRDVRPQSAAPQERVHQLLELLLERHAAASDSDNWSALLCAVEQLQRELEAHCGSNPSGVALEARAARTGAQHILDALPVGILQLDASGELRYANAAARHLLQLRGGAAGARLEHCLAQPALAETILNLRHHVGGVGVDCRFSTPDGPVVARLSAIAPAPGRDELVIVAQDISELKQVERTRDEFLAHLTHELRTPLTNIQAYAETLKDDFFDDEKTRRECYDVIMGEARRLAKLIEDVLSVSQIDAGAARLTRGPVRVDDLLRAAAREVQAAADAKGIELVLEIPPRVPTLQGDRVRLQQVWANMLSNALKFTPSGGAIRAGIEPRGHVMRLSVADTGIGIAPRWHKLIFEKFFRVQEPAVQATEGTGLGLTLVRDIVRLHGGSVQVDSTPGRGARFTVELPLAAWTAERPVSEHSAGGDAI